MAHYSSPAKHMFYYLLSLVTLGFTSIGVGKILFQIINATFLETTFSYESAFSPWELQFGISSVIVTAPIFFFLGLRIQKDLAAKLLNQDSAIRKWLTYLILFISSLVIIGVLIELLNNFFQGELTVKFILKALSVLLLSSAIFSFYLFDIRREKFVLDPVVKRYAWGFVIVTLATLISGFFFLESPSKIRTQREDQERLSRLQSMHYEIQEFSRREGTLPKDLDFLKDRFLPEQMQDPVTKEALEYRIVSKTEYELCTTFALSNKDSKDVHQGYYYPRPPYAPYEINWWHEAGRHCFPLKVEKVEKPPKE